MLKGGKEMNNKKKGLSTVVTALIIILLVLVAIGIVWIVVRDVIERGTQSIDINVKCLEVDVRATAVTSAGGTDYDVTLTRKAKGDEIGGVKLVFYNDAGNSGVVEFGEGIDPLDTVTKTVYDTEITGANKIDVTVYFIDESGNPQLCTQTNSFSF